MPSVMVSQSCHKVDHSARVGTAGSGPEEGESEVDMVDGGEGLTSGKARGGRSSSQTL